METLGTMFSWAVFGLVVGFIARMLYPGRQPLGFFGTMALGVLGSFLGGAIAWVFGYRPDDGVLHGSGWIMSIVGAMIVVWMGLFAGSRSTRTGMRSM